MKLFAVGMTVLKVQDWSLGQITKITCFSSPPAPILGAAPIFLLFVIFKNSFKIPKKKFQKKKNRKNK